MQKSIPCRLFNHPDYNQRRNKRESILQSTGMWTLNCLFNSLGIQSLDESCAIHPKQSSHLRAVSRTQSKRFVKCPSFTPVHEYKFDINFENVLVLHFIFHFAVECFVRCSNTKSGKFISVLVKNVPSTACVTCLADLRKCMHACGNATHPVFTVKSCRPFWPITFYQFTILYAVKTMLLWLIRIWSWNGPFQQCLLFKGVQPNTRARQNEQYFLDQVTRLWLKNL